MNARRCALVVVCALTIVCSVVVARALPSARRQNDRSEALKHSRPMSRRDTAPSDSSPFLSFLDMLYSIDPMFRLDKRALDEAKDAGKPVEGFDFAKDASRVPGEAHANRARQNGDGATHARVRGE